MKTAGAAILVALVAYAVGIGLGILLVNFVSTNRHDRAVEAIMTGLFFGGPALAILSVIAFFVVRAVRSG